MRKNYQFYPGFYISLILYITTKPGLVQDSESQEAHSCRWRREGARIGLRGAASHQAMGSRWWLQGEKPGNDLKGSLRKYLAEYYSWVGYEAQRIKWNENPSILNALPGSNKLLVGIQIGSSVSIFSYAFFLFLSPTS